MKQRVRVTHAVGRDRRTVAHAAPTVVATERGIVLRVPGVEGKYDVSVPGPVLRAAMASWGGMATLALKSRVVAFTHTRKVTAYEDLPEVRQRAFERLVRGWQEVAAAGGDTSGAEESLGRWLAQADDTEEAEVERVNALRRKLGLADV